MKKSIFTIALTVLVTVGAAADETDPEWNAEFLCVADQSTGFKLNGTKWEETSFITDSKYIVNSVKNLHYEWAWRPFVYKRDSPGMVCELYEASEYLDDDADELVCASAIQTFNMNLETQRFFFVYRAGYIDGNDAGDTPHIEIGTCAKL